VSTSQQDPPPRSRGAGGAGLARRHARTLQILVGLLIGGLILWWTFRGTQWDKVWLAMRESHLGWLLAAQLMILLSFFVRVQRWSYIVRVAAPVSFRRLFNATQIGFLANFTLPGRVGELIRAVVLSRRTQLPFTKCFAFVALDRVTDLFGLMVVMLITVVAFRPVEDIRLPSEILETPIPAQAIQSGALVTALVIIALVSAFVMLYVNKRLMLRISDTLLGVLSQRFAQYVHGMLDNFADGMHVFRSARDMSKALAFSLLTWGVGALHFHFLFLAFHLSPPWYVGIAVMALLSIAIALPGPPGFVGPFHIAIVAVVLVTMPATELDTARAAAILAHLVNVVGVVAVGLYSLHNERVGLLELRREGEEVLADH